LAKEKEKRKEEELQEWKLKEERGGCREREEKGVQ
jgi:hypothetical protein